MTALWRIAVDTVPRLARGPADAGPTELLDLSALGVRDLDDLLARPDGADAVARALAAPALGPVPAGAVVLPPVQSQPVWATGVTYERSRQARNAESSVPDVYDRVYEAERPELFLKAMPGTVRGPGQTLGIRADSGWDVPEPELVLVLDAAGAVAGYCCGNDMSSRSIEGENPLYLPQAKLYRDSCGIGPCLVPAAAAPPLAELTVSLRIDRDGSVAFEGSVPFASMRRAPGELASWLFRCLDLPAGALLMTGTGIVPGDDVTLHPGDVVTVAITGLGALVNPVATVGAPLI